MHAPHSLFITNDFPPRIGGAQSYYWELIKTLDPSEVVVVAPDQPGGREFDTTHPYSVHRYPVQQLRPTKGLLRLALRLIEQHGVKVVQFATPSDGTPWPGDCRADRSPLSGVPGWG